MGLGWGALGGVGMGSLGRWKRMSWRLGVLELEVVLGRGGFGGSAAEGC